MPNGTDFNSRKAQELLYAQIKDYKLMYDGLRRVFHFIEGHIQKEYEPNFGIQINDNRYPLNKVSANECRDETISQALTLSGIVKNTGPPEAKNYSEEQFYRWIDNSRINGDNCPEDLAYLLIAIHDALKGRNEKLLKAVKQSLNNDSYKSGIKEAENAKDYFAALSASRHEVEREIKSLQGVTINEDNIGNHVGSLIGDAKKGREIFVVIENNRRPYYENYNLFTKIQESDLE
ncbi:hypothetical protein RhiirA5_407322 [Rhizophagus irregularis]|uniref:Uncharacterized protein n=1 Tax=Rhizophagus irregularis TaxID=588596 RepID=A0A2N0QAS5_9GLOM|nr:hypothetical protein RhiirA5_407322 [Rhizophagus irregularis]PKC66808.1 hypothetical protein RhiirA1_459226 [Rhizophagus irregularis]CAB4485245.1 unnamed protein product [Rhizophagus irregularis]CAB5197470.1 unnamed protein product [Rhizophagus irregularis]